jgi:hypothetical protein
LPFLIFFGVSDLSSQGLLSLPNSSPGKSGSKRTNWGGKDKGWQLIPEDFYAIILSLIFRLNLLYLLDGLSLPK